MFGTGIDRKYVAELHGNIFKEICPKCKAEYFRPYDVKGMSFKPTGNRCQKRDCDGSSYLPSIQAPIS
jgi:mono-ADP-ribosyltransferase sirtuin 6